MTPIERSLVNALLVLGAPSAAAATPQIDIEGRLTFEVFVGGHPFDVFARFLDVDGDGRKDYASGGEDTDQAYLVVSLDRGNGAFELVHSGSWITAVNPIPTAIACGDLDGNGVREIVYATTTDRLVFLSRLANGSYAQISELPIQSTYVALDTGDLDGDGDVDIVGLRHDGTLRVHVNQNGAFSAAQVTGPVSASVRASALGDMDGDGDLDAVVASESPAGEVSVLLNAGNGAFSPAIPAASTARPTALALADFDLDGALDVVTVNPVTATVRVLRNAGGGVLAAPIASPAGAAHRRLDVGDADGDGDPDLVLSGGSSGGVAVLAHVGSGAFATPAAYDSGTVPHAALTDLDADGDLDLAIVGRDAQRNRGDGTFVSDPFEALPFSLSSGVTGGDLDGDGDEDLVHSGFSTIATRSNLGDGAFGAMTTVFSGLSLFAVQLEDVEGDGDLDLLVLNHSLAGLRVLLNQGGTFGAPIAIGPGVSTPSVAIGDVDGDGRLDLVTKTGVSFYVALSTGVAAWAPFTQIAGVSTSSEAGWGVADLDGDGDPDLVTSTANELSVRANLGGLAFAPPNVIAAIGTVRRILAPDIDGDGDDDLVCSATTALCVVVNSGVGTFVTTVLGPAEERFFVDDLDHDGDFDVIGESTTRAARSYENTGAATFAPGAPVGTARSGSFAAIDADVDGDEDFVLVAMERFWIQDNRASTGTSFCAGDGSGTACPCGNASTLGSGLGCVNSHGRAGALSASGSSSLLTDTLRLRGAGMTNGIALYFQGTSAVTGGAGAVFGDGLRCVAGTIVRLGLRSNVAGASTFPSAGQPPLRVLGQVSAPGTRLYQVWYRDAASFCTAATWNLTNALRVGWGA